MKRTAILVFMVISLVLMASIPATADSFSDIITQGPWVDSRAYSSLGDADNAARTAGKILVITQNYTITSSTTLQAKVFVLPGGGFTWGTGGNLSFTGGFEAGNFQVFTGFTGGDFNIGYSTGDSDLSFKNCPACGKINVLWMGAVADAATDNKETLRTAAKVAQYSGLPMWVAPHPADKYYKITGAIPLNKITMIGEKGHSRIKNTRTNSTWDAACVLLGTYGGRGGTHSALDDNQTGYDIYDIPLSAPRSISVTLLTASCSGENPILQAGDIVAIVAPETFTHDDEHDYYKIAALNKVVSCNSTTGEVTLKYPLADPNRLSNVSVLEWGSRDTTDGLVSAYGARTSFTNLNIISSATHTGANFAITNRANGVGTAENLTVVGGKGHSISIAGENVILSGVQTYGTYCDLEVPEDDRKYAINLNSGTDSVIIRNASLGDSSARTKCDIIRFNSPDSEITNVSIDPGVLSYFKTLPVREAPAWTHTGSTVAKALRTYSLPAGTTARTARFRIKAAFSTLTHATTPEGKVEIQFGTWTLSEIPLGVNETAKWTVDIDLGKANDSLEYWNAAVAKTISGTTTVTSSHSSGTLDTATNPAGIVFKVTLANVTDTLTLTKWIVEPENQDHQTPPLGTVTSPSGGETWQPGTTHAITWACTGTPDEYVKIELYKGGSLNGTIISSTPIGSGGNGSYNWTIPAGQTVGSDYKVKITGVANAALSDMSEADFTVAP